jgi:ABC-type oligopeptide transport system substrate-binding subunit
MTSRSQRTLFPSASVAAHRPFFLLVPFLLLVAGCSGSDDDASSVSDPGGSVVSSETTAAADDFSFSVSIGEPAAIDPGLAQEVEGLQVTRLLFETLTTLTPDLALAPGGALDWSVDDDGVTWTFNLDPEATFSDGRPVVADDYVFGFARSADPDFAAPSSYQGYPIAGWAAVNEGEPSGAIGDEPVAGVTAVDDHTLVIETEEPFSLLPKVMTYPIFAPIAAEYVDTEDKAAAFAEQPIGNGPYMMAEPWDHNAAIAVVRNTEYTGTPGVADRIEFPIYAESATAFKDFQAGAIDIARSVPAELVSQARADYPDTFNVSSTAALAYIGFPTDVAPFDDPAIRAALSMAIDREAIAERVWSGTQAPATGMVPPSAPGALTEPCAACVYDPERAKAMFDEAGGIPGNSMTFYDIADDGQASIDPILNSWRELFGIDIEVQSFEFAQFLEETAPGAATGPFELGWVWDYPSGYSILAPLFESTSGANNLGYANDDFDEQMRLVREAADEDAGLAYLTEGQRIVEADMPIAPITFLADIGVYSERLSGVVVDEGAAWRLELVRPA